MDATRAGNTAHISCECILSDSCEWIMENLSFICMGMDNLVWLDDKLQTQRSAGQIFS